VQLQLVNVYPVEAVAIICKFSPEVSDVAEEVAVPPVADTNTAE
jgi:hypothetical protein